MSEEHYHVIYKYLRSHKKFPSVWCPGCGIGIVLGAIVRAVDHLNLNKDDIAMVSGIGCSGRMPVYVDFNTMHTTHGRALPFATGLKLAKPHMKVIVVMGDGDALAIGGNHFIHACRRNIDLTAIIINNSIYAMTGGQVSPTTPTNSMATTATYGNIERPFDIAAMAQTAGAAMVARGTVYHAMELERLVAAGLEKKGFSVLEVLSHCHVAYGRLNQSGPAVEMMKAFRRNTVSVEQAGTPGAQGKITRGILMDRDIPEYVEQYQALRERAQGKAAAVPKAAPIS
ncbi:MAG: 2-oxoacid:ferredoxin oxidoreductase subunit beta [Bacteroidetes bacterium]|nr:2-oxoacid:ferredoxin oxidoreductase subunit beta [Bacteroidota bacterium]